MSGFKLIGPEDSGDVHLHVSNNGEAAPAEVHSYVHHDKPAAVEASLSQVKIEKNSRGYNWEIVVAGSSIVKVTEIIAAVDSRLRLQFPAEEGAVK